MSTKRKRELVKLAQMFCPNATVEHSGHHLQVNIIGPNGVKKIFASSTASDHRDLKNLKREFARAAQAVGLTN